jgi:hypothetical protein
MIQRTKGMRGRHGPPPVDCDHRGHARWRGGEVRCGRCWRVCRYYPQAIWHYAQRHVGLEDMQRLPSGGTI